MFLFDNFEFLKDDKYTIINDGDKYILEKSAFNFDNNTIKYLSSNHREGYRLLSSRYIDGDNLFEIEEYKNDYIKLNSCQISSTGLIKDLNGDIYVHGGCSNMKRGDFSSIKKYKKVISISCFWSDCIWHFPTESLVGLKPLMDLIDDGFYIHITKKNKYTLQWLEILGIDSDKVIDGNISAEESYFPRLGKCGNPYFSQIKWLRDKIIENNELIEEEPNLDNKNLILIRRKKRSLSNSKGVESLLSEFCSKLGVNLYIHDDNNLPSLKEQQAIFSKASWVVAPHGAGGIHLLSMPKDSYYIEFLNSEINICYSRLSYLLGISYEGIGIEGSFVDLKNLYNVIERVMVK